MSTYSHDPLFDEFAKAAITAMSGLVAGIPPSMREGQTIGELTAMCCYDLAESMMKERERRMRNA